MPFCGLNEKMLKGLIDLTEGLVEHGLLYRSKKNNETIDQAVKREISDMTRFLSETHKIDDSGKRMFTEGMIKYAMGFYLITRNNGVDNYKELVSNIGEYFHSMDNKYYSELEGKPDDMKQLVEFLNEFKINHLTTTTKRNRKASIKKALI